MARRRRGGFFLVVVLIVIAAATLAVYSFTELMIAYDDSAYLSGDLVQARVNVESGTDTIRMVLSQPRNSREDIGGLYNNPNLFQAITVSLGPDGATPSNYTVVAPGLDEFGKLGGIRFGLQDESARLNVNALTLLEKYSTALTATVALASEGDAEMASDNISVSLLMTLPGMTEDVAEAILDWIDEDIEPREFGAEYDYYSTLPTPYAPPNGPLQSVEELLLVRGITPQLLFGVDANRNGVVDADEQQRYGAGIDTPGALGWAAYLTVHGAENNKTGDGYPRVDVNQDDLEALYDELVTALGDEAFASFIVAYRIAGEADSSAAGDGAGGGGDSGEESDQGGGGGGRGSSDGGGGGGGGGDEEKPPIPWTADALDELDLTAGGQTNITQILQLIDAQVTVGEGDEAQTYQSPFLGNPVSMAGFLPGLMDALSTQNVDVLPGRINLNECPAELLYGIPILDVETIEAIIEARQDTTDDINRKFATWPLVEGLVTVDQMKLLLPLLTGGGDVFRAQIVGYYELVGASHRSEVIIDATSVNPKVVAIRDLTHLGRGFDRSVLGVRTSVAAGL